MDCASRVNESRMFSKNLVKVLLVGLVDACGAARFGAVIEDGHAEAPVTAAVLVVTVLLLAFR